MTTYLQSRVANYLYEHCLGKSNAASRRQLCAALTCGDRDLRKCIEALRRDGHAVGVAEGGGYYMAADAGEVAEIVEGYRTRVVSECQTANLLRQRWPGVAGLQLVLVEDGGQARLIA